MVSRMRHIIQMEGRNFFKWQNFIIQEGAKIEIKIEFTAALTSR
jgi:hypothetical protein